MTSKGQRKFLHPCLSYEIENLENLTAEDEAARPVIKRSMFICRLLRLPGFIEKKTSFQCQIFDDFQS